MRLLATHPLLFFRVLRFAPDARDKAGLPTGLSSASCGCTSILAMRLVATAHTCKHYAAAKGDWPQPDREPRGATTLSKKAKRRSDPLAVCAAQRLGVWQCHSLHDTRGTVKLQSVVQLEHGLALVVEARPPNVKDAP